MRPVPLIAALALLGVTACTQFPQLDRTISPQLENADYPALVPVDPLLTQVSTRQATAEQTQAQLQGRLTRLRARAQRLRGAVLNGAERQRLREGLK